MNTISLEHNPDASNMAGIFKVTIINVNSIETMLPYKDEVIITTVNNPEIYSVKSKDVEVQSTMIKQGLYNHEVTLRAYTKNAKPSHAIAFDALSRKRFVVLLHYNNGKTFVIGNPEERIKLSFEDVSDGKADGVTGYILTFFGRTTEPQQVLNTLQ